MKYVGETKKSVRKRLAQHRYNIKHGQKMDTQLIQHFILHKLESVRLTVLQTGPLWTDVLRKKQERQWINTLGTRHPYGLNTQ